MKIFEIKPYHISLLSKAYVTWNEMEFGAPSIDPKRPYGNSDVYSDISEVLGFTKKNDEYSAKEYAKMSEVHNQLTIALQIILQNLGKSEYIGLWQSVDYGVTWKPQD